MKELVIFIIAFSSLTAFGQVGKLKLSITITGDTTYQYVDIWLEKRDSLVKRERVTKSGVYYLDNIKAGIYDFSIRDMISRPFKLDSLNILADSITSLTIVYPGPCKFIYTKNYKPKCPYNHTDNIVKISYGLPNSKTMAKAKKGLLHLGGCMITDCDPKYYCTLHKIEF